MFFPSNTFELYGIKLMEVLTFNTFRGAISGTLIGSGLILLTGLLTKNKTWYHSSILLMSVILFSKIYSVIVDGWTNAKNCDGRNVYKRFTLYRRILPHYYKRYPVFVLLLKMEHSQYFL